MADGRWYGKMAVGWRFEESSSLVSLPSPDVLFLLSHYEYLGNFRGSHACTTASGGPGTGALEGLVPVG